MCPIVLWCCIACLGESWIYTKRLHMSSIGYKRGQNNKNRPNKKFKIKERLLSQKEKTVTLVHFGSSLLRSLLNLSALVATWVARADNSDGIVLTSGIYRCRKRNHKQSISTYICITYSAGWGHNSTSPRAQIKLYPSFFCFVCSSLCDSMKTTVTSSLFYFVCVLNILKSFRALLRPFSNDCVITWTETF